LDPFEVIVGGEDVAAHKPDPESLVLALGKLRADHNNSLYVGDSVVDAKTAENAGVPFVAVLSGVTPRESFGGFEGIQIIENVQDLPALFSQFDHDG
jgi:phosphoglycolate phosphatase